MAQANRVLILDAFDFLTSPLPLEDYINRELHQQTPDAPSPRSILNMSPLFENFKQYPNTFHSLIEQQATKRPRFTPSAQPQHWKQSYNSIKITWNHVLKHSHLAPYYSSSLKYFKNLCNKESYLTILTFLHIQHHSQSISCIFSEDFRKGFAGITEFNIIKNHATFFNMYTFHVYDSQLSLFTVSCNFKVETGKIMCCMKVTISSIKHWISTLYRRHSIKSGLYQKKGQC